jgi:Lon protease-like protein
LSEGINSVSWLPPLTDSKEDSGTPTSVRNGAEILPLFPLGGIVYTPNSEHVLNIFEPRYRSMYNDILMNGSKRFVVAMSHPEKSGVFAEVGVIFELQDLKEVSEETGDAIKYICNHKVTGRVKIHKILNPSAWKTRATYLKCEGTIIDESLPDAGQSQKDEEVPGVYETLIDAINPNGPKSKAEKELVSAFSKLVDRQHELQEDVRFTRASVDSLAVKPGGGEKGLWMTIRLWQSFIEQRLVARQNEMQMEFQEKLLKYLKKEKGLGEDEIPSAIGFEDLSKELQDELKELQKRMSIELQPMVLESMLAIQKILEAENHTARCEMLKVFIESETRRLDAKKTLQGMFSVASKLTDERAAKSSVQDLENRFSAVKEDQEDKTSRFFDDEDAFQ